LMLYTNYISAHDQIMEGVFVFDDRDPDLSSTIIAKQGRISSDQKNMSLNLHLTDGASSMVSKDLDSSRMMRFNSYDVNVELSDIMKKFSSRTKREREMSLSEIRDNLKKLKKGTTRHNIFTIAFQRKFTVPFSCLLLGIIGLPLGLMMRLRGRSWGIALSIFVFVVYYILLSAGESLGETGSLNPVFAMWMPNTVLGVATFILTWLAARDV
jgi:lipopolysaccharide export system permease protein